MTKRIRTVLLASLVMVALSGAYAIFGDCAVFPNSTPQELPGGDTVCQGTGSGCEECWTFDSSGNLDWYCIGPAGNCTGTGIDWYQKY